MSKYVTNKENFGWHEFVVSATHPEMLKSFYLTRLDKEVITLGVQSILDPVRDHFGERCLIRSGKRSPELNLVVDGSVGSDHLTANAVDYVIENVPPIDVYTYILKMDLPYRQLIYYPKTKEPFLHTSWNIPSKPYLHEAFVNF